MNKPTWREKILLQEDLNFLLTNRVPRIALTRFMGWFSRIQSPWLTRVSIAVWRLFTPLDLSDARVVELVQLADPQFVLDKADIPALLKKENEPGAVLCSDPLLARFLDGLVVWRRGRDESLPPRPVEDRISNNLVLKKLRVAFELKDVDMHEVFSGAGFPITKPELTALFRQPGHKNYRPCGDQILRNFLKGLTLRFRTGE